jgi:hypothetical protein
MIGRWPGCQVGTSSPGGIVVFDLSEGAAGTVGGFLLGAVLLATAIGWLAAMAAIAAAQRMPSHGRALAVILAFIAVPLAAWGYPGVSSGPGPRGAGRDDTGGAGDRLSDDPV